MSSLPPHSLRSSLTKVSGKSPSLGFRFHPLSLGSHGEIKYFQSILYSLLHPSQLQLHSQAFALAIPSPSLLDTLSGILYPSVSNIRNSPWIKYFPTLWSMCSLIFFSVTEANKLCQTHGALSGGQEQLQVYRPFWLLRNLLPDCLFTGASFPGS